MFIIELLFVFINNDKGTRCREEGREFNINISVGRCNCSCFEIDQEMDAILLIIGIVYGVCRIVIKSVQQCTYFLFSVNLLLVGVNYGQRTMQVCS